MATGALRGPTRARLKLWLGAFFLALALPTALLVWKAYDQLKWEVFYQYRQQAEALTSRIDAELSSALADAEARGFADYSFLVVAGDPSANFLQRSSLSSFPVTSAIPGLLGYFQVDAEGRFSTPLLPEDDAPVDRYGIPAEEYRQRQELKGQILAVLADNQLVQSRRAQLQLRPAEEPASSSELELDSLEMGLESFAGSREAAGNETTDPDSDMGPLKDQRAAARSEDSPQAQFDDVLEKLEASRYRDNTAKLNRAVQAEVPPARTQRVDELNLDQTYEQKASSLINDKERQVRSPSVRAKRKEQTVLPQPQGELEEVVVGEAGRRADGRVRTFESELDPFDFSLLNSGHFVLFRKVWRDGQRYIQGAVIEQQPFLAGAFQRAFQSSALAAMSELIVAHQGDVLAVLSEGGDRYTPGSEELAGSLLYRTRLLTPLDSMELIFSIKRLPAGPGGALLGWVSVILAVLLVGGLLALYRLGARQIALARQQQDFVSAVSHELKTPLTSIRMYGEMLKEGWADGDKRQTYYEYIYDESERLSRLIANVLQLARMSHNELSVENRPTTVDELMDLAKSKIASQVQRAGFELRVAVNGDAGSHTVEVDPDAFSQVVINLVDNALKFSSEAANKAIELTVRPKREGGVLFAIRDFGPGVPKDQMRKIFKLFYRSESELTRETVGTGIGLALVNQLCQAMNGRIDVVNREPGAEFQFWFPSTR